MKKRTADDFSKGEEPSLTQTATHFISGTVAIIDIDNLEEIVTEKGWSRYRPNPATGLLTNLIDELVRKWQAIVVYGLDWNRGTEEVVLEIPGTSAGELKGDLIDIARRLCENSGITVTIVAVTSYVTGRPAKKRREAYSSYRRWPKKILESLKRKGGNRVYIDGEIVRLTSCQRK